MVIDLTKLKLDGQNNSPMNTLKETPKYSSQDLMKGFGLSDTQASGIDWNKAQSSVGNFMKSLSPDQSKLEAGEFKTTGSFSSGLKNQFKNYLTQQKINQNENQLFGNTPAGVVNTSSSPISQIPEQNGAQTQTNTLITGTNTTNIPTYGKETITGIDQLSQMADEMGTPLNETTKKELIKNIAQGNKDVEDYLNAYAVGAGEYAKNKGYYTNFDDVNKTRDNILKDVSSQLKANNGPLTDDQYQNIATKYGLTLDQVKNPNSLYKNLQLSDTGKKELGYDVQQQNITNLTTDFERKKQDIKTNLDQNLTQVDQKISDIQKNLDQNISVMENTFGFGTGAKVSTGFQQGINNMRQDTQTTVNRLKESADLIKTASDTDLERLTQDYNQAYTRATDDLKTQLEKVNQSIGVDLTGLTETYGMGSQEMGKKLDEIAEKYNLNSMDLIGKYIDNIRKVNANISDSLDIQNKIYNQQETIANKRYNEYLSNDGVLLGNTNLNTLMGEYKNGTLSAQKLIDLENIMKTSVVNTLSKLGTVGTDDINTITNLLETGKTPTEVIAQMQTLDKFTPKETISVDKTIDLGDRTRVYYSNGQYEDIKKGEENKFGFQNVGEGTIAVTDPKTGNVKFEKITNIGTSTTRDNAISTYGSTPAVRNFNPGNITDTGFGGYKAEGERFTRFDTPQQGFSALVAKIQNIQNGNSATYSPDMTLLEYMSKYAPASDNNNPTAYANSVAKDLGVNINTTIGELDPVKLASAQAKHEDRNSYKMLLDLGIIKEDGSLGTQTTGGVSQEAKDWVELWNKGTMDIDTIMTKIGNSKEALPLKNEVAKAIGEQGGIAWRTQEDPTVKNMVNLKDTLVSLLSSDRKDYLDDVAGTFQFSPWDSLTGEKQNFLSDIQYVIDSGTLQNLIDAKAQGATFGALSNEELKMLQASANKIAGSAIRDENGNITGFKMSDVKFRNELKNLKKLYEDKIDRMTGKGIVNKPTTETPTSQVTGRWQSQINNSNP